MFGLFKKKPAKLEPESRWTVAFEGEAICVTDHTGKCSYVAKDELSGVAVETNDSGPWGMDVWWILFGANDQLACAFPQGATGEQAILDFLLALPSFDHDSMGRAMRSTDNAVFPVWRHT